ncbi:MAG: M20/M25/M40 family metallo-hydrolase [Deltaproteobacteria bacterium]|nr:M20/M25/M40 family metallo-hydrolase [Deltaproteobacteria bacterium]
MNGAPAQLFDETLELLRTLIRIDTTNPPGNELPAAELLADYFRRAGLEPVLLESAPGRGNLVVRVRGDGTLPPLLLTGHLDVVPAEADAWTHPPFSGDVADGCVWGRGAVDMKQMVALSAAVVAAMAREGRKLTRDLVFAAVADEEEGCTFGSKFLVDEHKDLVAAEYALGEVGGFTVAMNGRTIVPVQVAQKGIVWLRARAEGDPGHGSMPTRANATVRLARAMARLGESRLPQHNTEVMERFIHAVADTQPALKGFILRRLLSPTFSDFILTRLFPDPDLARPFYALLSNTATPTVLRAGSKTNVIPSVAEGEIDGRTLPGQSADDLVREVFEVTGTAIDLEPMRVLPPLETDVDTPLFVAIRAAVNRHLPDATVVPSLTPGFTDAVNFARLGTKYYGFVPTVFPESMKFSRLFHGHDERVPIDGLRVGLDVLYDLVTTFCCAV